MTFLSSFESVGKVNIDNRQVVCTYLEDLNSFSKGLQVVLECCRVCNTCLVSSCGENLSALSDSCINSSTEGCLVTCTIELICIYRLSVSDLLWISNGWQTVDITKCATCAVHSFNAIQQTVTVKDAFT